MRTRIVAVVTVVVGTFAFADNNTASTVDLVGRKGEFTVKSKGGKVETLTSNDLPLAKELMPSAPRTKPGESTGGIESQAKKPPLKPLVVKAPVVVEESPESKAIRAADVEQLRQMRNQGGAYFYTEDDQPVPFEEIDRRIATGEVEGLKVVGLHLQEWRPETKSSSSRIADELPETPPAEAAVPVKKQY
ncbi:MAG: hypothetical protein SGI88_00995 [Candidatus Hydrogenedentes bacterium]|nr:hypothetical protein [Candidatus Hydrogenedentota bacterium]